MMTRGWVAVLIASWGVLPAQTLKYSFGPKAVPGYTQVAPAAVYTTDSGYGFDLGSNAAVINRGGDDPLKAGFVTGRNGRPFFFSAKLPAGAYRVTVTLGDAAAESTTTVKSETRRLMQQAGYRKLSARRKVRSAKRCVPSAKCIASDLLPCTLCAMRYAPCVIKGALEGGDFSRKVVQTFQEVISTDSGYELSAVKDNEHVGVFEGRATSNVQELEKFTL